VAIICLEVVENKEERQEGKEEEGKGWNFENGGEWV
jgi:hypothetical protein